MPYLNGQVPYSVVSVVLASGTDSNGYWEFRCTPAFAARWAAAKRYAEAHFGRTLHIRPGWNIYRPLFSQQIARTNACAQGNCRGAAYPGTSSHGGDWNGRICLAVDVDPNGLPWSKVDEAMESAGFSAGLITPAISGFPGGEPWHYILFGDLAFGAVPAGLNASPFEEDDMFTDEDRKTLEKIRGALLDGIPGRDLSRGRLDQIADATHDLSHRFLIDVNGDGTSDYDLTQLTVNEIKPMLQTLIASVGRVSGSPVAAFDVEALAAAIREGLGAEVADELAKRLTNG